MKDLHAFEFHATWRPEKGEQLYDVVMDGLPLQGVTHVHIETSGDDPLPRVTLTFAAREVTGLGQTTEGLPQGIADMEAEVADLRAQYFLTDKDMQRLGLLMKRIHAAKGGEQ